MKNSDYCEYIRPPIDRYRTLQFGSFDEIREVGYAHGKAYFEGQLKAGVLPIFKSHNPVPCVQQQHLLSGYTFTDLAQMVCKVSRWVFVYSMFLYFIVLNLTNVINILFQKFVFG